MQADATQSHAANREEAGKNLKTFAESLLMQIGQIGALQKQELEKFSAAVSTAKFTFIAAPALTFAAKKPG